MILYLTTNGYVNYDFISHDQWICKYVEMLSEFSNLVHNLGFKVR